MSILSDLMATGFSAGEAIQLLALVSGEADGVFIDLHVTNNAQIDNTLKIGSAGTITGFGYGSGQAMGPLTTIGGIPSVRPSTELIFSRLTPAITDASDFRFRRDTTALSGGTSANINKTLQVETGIGANDGAQNWGFLSKISSSSTVGGISLPAYMQSWRAAGSNAWIWGAIVETADFTGNDSATVGNPTSSMEIDLGTTGADNAVNASKWGGFGNRHMIHFVATRNQGSAENEISTGLWFGTTNTRIDSIIGADLGGGGARTYQVLDTRGFIAPNGVTDPVASVRMAAGQVIDFDGGAALNSAPGRYLVYASGTGRFSYWNGSSNTELLRLADAGDLTINRAIISGGDITVGALLRLKSYPVGSLPSVTAADAGATVWASNCRQNGEGGGAGTGSIVYVDVAGVWKAVWSGLAPTV